MVNNYEEFKKAFWALSKIDLNSYKENQMKRRIDNFISKHRCAGYVDFFDLIKKDGDVYDMFITYLTINVSEFYRNPAQWRTLESVIIPHLIGKFGKKLKVWSAACSTGDEPYSLAMVFNEFMPLSQVEIIATDLDKEVLAKAKKGIYNEKSIKGLPDKYVKQHFSKDDVGLYHVSESLKRCITFKEHNLLKDAYPTDVDLIVCRNVLIYFTDEAKNGIYQKFSKALKQEGVLFVGSTEQIIGAGQYGLESFQSFFYKKL